MAFKKAVKLMTLAMICAGTLLYSGGCSKDRELRELNLPLTAVGSTQPYSVDNSSRIDFETIKGAYEKYQKDKEAIPMILSDVVKDGSLKMSELSTITSKVEELENQLRVIKNQAVTYSSLQSKDDIIQALNDPQELLSKIKAEEVPKEYVTLKELSRDAGKFALFRKHSITIEELLQKKYGITVSIIWGQ